jgi:elongation factor Ts
MAKAEEILRVKLGNKAARLPPACRRRRRRRHHIAADGKLAAIVEVNCETDFVAKNDDFLAFTKAGRAGGQQQPGRCGCLSACRWRRHGRSHPHRAGRQDRREHVDPPLRPHRGRRARWRSYIHGGAKIGVLVDVVGGDETLAKDLAMHIAASKPKSLDASGVPADLIERAPHRDRKGAEPASRKPCVEKIAEGTVQKFLKEVTLLGQVFVKAEDGKQTIEQLLKAKGASVAAFVLYVVGEGIEKKVTDFAAEVAAQAAQAAAAR